MKIGFDAKRVFYNRSGLGNYSRHIIDILGTYHPKLEMNLYSPKTKNAIPFSLPQNAYIQQPNLFIDRQMGSFWRQKSIVGQMKKDQIEIFHGLSNELPFGIHKSGIKSIVSIHDLIFLRYPELYKKHDRWIYTKKFKHACEHADIVIAISQQTKNDIIEFLGINESKIEVIYQSCNDLFATEVSVTEKEMFRKKHLLPKQFILNVGTIEKRKNALSIIKAVIEDDIDTNVVFAGRKTKYIKEIEAYLFNKKYKQKFIFLEGLSNDELNVLYHSADLFIYPSIFEGFGIPILEAMKAGLPVISSNISSMPEAAGKHSILINPFSTEEIGNCIRKLLENKHLRKNIIEQNKEHLVLFNYKNIANHIYRTYQKLI